MIFSKEARSLLEGSYKETSFAKWVLARISWTLWNLVHFSSKKSTCVKV